MRKLHSKKGFTLMEMLIVVAIIVILVAIAIPTFTGALEKAREATDVANIRAAYAEAMMKYLDGGGAEVTVESQPMTQTEAGWADGIWPSYFEGTALSVVAPNIVYVTVNAAGEASCSLTAPTP